MSNILEMLKNEKVEWKKLGEVCEIKNGELINKKFIDMNRGEYPVINSGKEPLGFVNKYNTENDPIGITTRGNVGLVTYQEGRYFRGNLNYSVTIIDNNQLKVRFLFHLLNEYQPQIKKLCNFSAIPSLNASELKKLEIPIPSLETQAEIVKILDTFTELIKELKNELNLRKKQYSYYRDKLLSEDYLNKHELDGNVVEWKKLGEVCECYDGVHQTPKYTENGVPFVSVKNIKNIYATDTFISKEDFDKYKIKPKKDDLFMTRIGDIGTCALVKNNEDLAYYVTLALLRPNQKIILTKFLKYMIESKYGQKELDKRILHKANPIKINLGEIPKLKFLIPSLEVQEHVVSILDKFNTLVNDISQGLPKEIDFRTKQYEYYREKLLTFNKN